MLKGFLLLSELLIVLYLIKKFSFKSNRSVASEILKYFIVWTISFILNSLVHDYSSEIISGYFPFIFATSISICINFLGAKYWVFKK